MSQTELNIFKQEAVIDAVLRSLPAKYRRISIQPIVGDSFRILYFPTGITMADLPKALPEGALKRLQKKLHCNIRHEHIDVPVSRYGMSLSIRVTVLDVLKYDNLTTRALDEHKSHNCFNEFFKLT